MTQRILDVDGNGVLFVRNKHLWNRAVNDIAANNTWCPDITRIIFNVGERKTKSGVKPTLATTVFFNDNTKITVLNSEHDDITLVKDPKTGATTASDVDKERGIVYATVKKLISKIDPKTGEMTTAGFGRILHELVDMGWDQQIEDKKRALKKAETKAKLAAAKPTAKKKPNASLYDTVNHLADVVDKLDAKLSTESTSKAKTVESKSTPRSKRTTTKKSARKLKRNAKGQFI